MTALIGSAIAAVALTWLGTVVVLAVREVWRDCVRARREREWALHRERHGG